MGDAPLIQGVPDGFHPRWAPFSGGSCGDDGDHIGGGNGFPIFIFDDILWVVPELFPIIKGVDS